MKRLVLIGFLVVGCSASATSFVLDSQSPAPTGEIGDPSTGTPEPSGEVGEPLECDIPEGCFLPTTDMEAP